MTYIGKPIGLSNLTSWPVTTDSETAYETGTAEKLARAIQVQLSPQFTEGLLESDDSVEDEVSLLSHIEVTIDSNQLTEEIRAALMGHSTDAAGGMSMGNTDTPQKRALAFRALLSKEAGENKYIYTVLYAGRFREFEETFETKKRGGISYQTHSGIRGTFYGRAKDGEIMYRLREGATEDPSNASKIAAFFTEPQDLTPSV